MKKTIILLSIAMVLEIQDVISKPINIYSFDSLKLTSQGIRRTKEDTLKALDKFNLRIHHNIKIIMPIAAIGLFASVVIAKNATDNQSPIYSIQGLFTGVMLGECYLSIKFNKKHFKRIMDNYKNGKPLPKQVMARLKEKDFN